MNRCVLADCESLKAKLRSLTRASQIKVAVGYSAPYSTYVHENLEIHHKPPTQAKYLEEPLKLLRKDMANYLRDRLRSKVPLPQALMEVGQKLLEASKQLVPVDTGELRDSGYVQLET